MSPSTASLCGTMLVSVVPIFVLFFMPLIVQRGSSKSLLAQKRASGSILQKYGNLRHHEHPHSAILGVLLCFAAGALLSDVFLHLLPHSATAKSGHGHGHGHGHGSFINGAPHAHGINQQGVAVLAGISAFFILDILLRHANGRSAARTHPKSRRGPAYSPSGYLNLVADAAHNFTDGLAISAAFHQLGVSGGLSTTLAVFCHEIPHEIGDYAILLKSGFTHLQAILAQFGTAGVALIGTLVGIWLESGSSSPAGSSGMHGPGNVLSFTAGGFLYISLCSILSEAVSTQKSSWTESIAEAFAFCTGIALIALLE